MGAPYINAGRTPLVNIRPAFLPTWRRSLAILGARFFAVAILAANFPCFFGFWRSSVRRLFPPGA